MPADFIKSTLKAIARGETLDASTMQDVLGRMTEGAATPAQMGAFLMGLAVRGETVAEITGAAQLLQSRMVRVAAPADAIDIVGTGGDGANTYNISTCAAIVASAAGAIVAKHGNRSVSSLSGSSDVLTALGVRVDCPIPQVERAIADVGIGFLWAPAHHPAMKAWAPVRAEIGARTLFNVLGPLCNPASVKRQLLGVFRRDLAAPLAEVLIALGSERAWVVHGHDGLDELSTTGPSLVIEVASGKTRTFEITPADAGLPTATIAQLQGGDAKANAAALTAVLADQPSPYRDIVVLNAGAALLIAGLASSLREGAARASEAISSGAARTKLDRLIAATQ